MFSSLTGIVVGRRAMLALAGALLTAVHTPALAADGPSLQLGRFQKEGEAWWTWTSIQRRQPTLAAALVPEVRPGEEQKGVVLSASAALGTDVGSLCRRLVGAGFSCLVVNQGSSPAEAAQAPAAPPPIPGQKPSLEGMAAPGNQGQARAGAMTVTSVEPDPAPVPASIPVAAPPQPVAVAVPVTVAVSMPARVQASEGTVTYSGDDAKVMKNIERSSRHRGRLGSVVIDTRYDVSAAALQRQGWRLCALTFDDGPHRVITRKILEVLNREGVQATYFPVASVAASQGAVIRDFIAAGHEVGNHSLSHADMRAMDAEKQRLEVTEANRILRSFGADPVLFRPPFGRYTADMVGMLRDEKMVPVLWNVDTRDWQVRDPDKIVQHVRTAAGVGSVLLMHSTYPSTLTALPRVIKELRDKGCEFVTLSEWIKRMESLAEPQMVNASEPSVISASAPIGIARP